MIEHGNSDQGEPAVDLSVLGPRDAAIEDRMVRVAMQRIAEMPDRVSRAGDEPVVRALAQWWRHGLVAAATVIALAGGSAIVFSRSAQHAPTVEARMFDWLASGNVPRNADLLSAFAASRQ